MNRVDAECLRSDLRAIAADVEQLMQDVTTATGERVEDTHARLRGIRERVVRMERDADERVRQTVARGRRYIHERPWGVIGGAAAVAFLAGLLSGRTRR
jgi:ElaB/YqjD/DUF883 family membrane-anchored ribosome-binding protein